MIFMRDSPFSSKPKRGLFCNNPSFEMAQYAPKYSSTDDLRPPKSPRGRTDRRYCTDPDLRALDALLKSLDIEKFTEKKKVDTPVPAKPATTSTPPEKPQRSSWASGCAVNSGMLGMTPSRNTVNNGQDAKTVDLYRIPWKVQPVKATRIQPVTDTHRLESTNSLPESQAKCDSVGTPRVHPVRIAHERPVIKGHLVSPKEQRTTTHREHVPVPQMNHMTDLVGHVAPPQRQQSSLPQFNMIPHIQHAPLPQGHQMKEPQRQHVTVPLGQPPALPRVHPVVNFQRQTDLGEKYRTVPPENPVSLLVSYPATKSDNHTVIPLGNNGTLTQTSTVILSQGQPVKQSQAEGDTNAKCQRSKPSRHSSGSDKIYNYRDPPPTLDKTKAEKVIEEERKKKERLQVEEQRQRRHSDYTPIKSPIITNERFRDPVISASDDARKQEVKACAIALYPFKAQTHKELSFNKGDIIYLLRKIDKNWFEGEHHGHAGIIPSSYVEVVTSLEDVKQAQLHGPGLEGKARAKYKFSGETQMELGFSKGEYIVLVKKIDANWWEGCIGDRKGIFPAAYVEVLREPTGVASSPAKKTQPATSHSPYQSPGQQMVQSSPKHQERPQAAPSHRAGRSPGSQGSYGGSQREPKRYFEEPTPKPSRTLAAAQDLFVASFAYTPQNEDEIELLEGDLVNVLEKCDDGWYVGMSERTGMFGTFPGNYVYKRGT